MLLPRGLPTPDVAQSDLEKARSETTPTKPAFVRGLAAGKDISVVEPVVLGLEAALQVTVVALLRAREEGWDRAFPRGGDQGAHVALALPPVTGGRPHRRREHVRDLARAAAKQLCGAGGAGRRRLVLLSFLLLFTELALIRWTGANVVYLSYFSNFVLLGSFLGIGIGFLRARQPRSLFPFAPVPLAALVVFVLAFPVSIDRSGGRLLFFGVLHPSGLPIWATLPVVFLAVTAVMAPIGEGVGRAFRELAPLEAYRLDVLGSLLGIAAFSLVSFLGLPPIGWGGVVAVVFVLLTGPRRVPVLSAIALLALVGALLWESWPPLTAPLRESWSPYYKIDVTPLGTDYDVRVNGIPHQEIIAVAQRRAATPIYFEPYELRKHGPLGNVLVIGAGTGSDVAIALAEGARHVDAVEIDPRLYELGRQLNPDRPYQDPRVSVHVGDGRAFIERTRERYDLILFALPDSLTLVSGQSSLRLESYLFTLEALRTARDRLTLSGAFAMYNYYREQWLIDRLAHTLELVYGRAPCIDQTGGVGRLALLAEGASSQALICPSPVWSADGRVVPPPARDDHPFLYLRDRSIPSLYLVALALVLGASLTLVRIAGGPLRAMRSHADLFLMGAAFLLLETKSVVQFALLFGTTWFVNALVFGGILAAVLAAIETARRFRLPRPALLYLCLLATLAAAWFVPTNRLLSLPFVPRLLAAIALGFAPVFLGNLVFAERFRATTVSTLAFAANLLGAMIGGVLEYASLLLGYRDLVAVVALLYGLAFLSARHAGQSAAQRRSRTPSAELRETHELTASDVSRGQNS